MGVPVVGMGRLFPQEICEEKPVARTCEKCGAPLRSNKCEYCGTEYESTNDMREIQRQINLLNLQLNQKAQEEFLMSFTRNCKGGAGDERGYNP